MKDAIENIKLRNIEEMMKDYKKIYQSFISKENKKVIRKIRPVRYEIGS